MANTSTRQLPLKNIAYFQQRLKNRIYEAIIDLFVQQANGKGLTKKDIAEKLGKDPALVNRWLAAPSNWSLETVSDLLLAMDAEIDVVVVPFSQRTRPNYAHRVMEYGTGISQLV